MPPSLKNWLLIPQVQKQPVRCFRSRARLGLEQLEKREVLSTASPSYVLNQGNLYQKTGVSLALLDRHVESYQADGHGEVAVLEQTRDLKYYSKPSLLTIDSGVTAYHLDSTGALVDLNSQGKVERYTPAAGTVLVDSGIQSIAFVASGRVYLLRNDGILLGSNTGLPGDFSTIVTADRSFAATTPGRVYVLNYDGSFLASNDGLQGDFSPVDTGVRSFALASTGRVYVLRGDGTFLASNDGLPGDFTQIATTVQQIALDSAGRIYDLQSNGMLLYSAAGHASTFMLAGRNVNSISLSNGSLVVNDWFSQNLNDPGVAAVARKQFALHDALAYRDMLALFRQADSGSTISADQLQSLRAVVANASRFDIPEAVEALASKTVNNDPADLHYRGHRLPALSGGVSSFVLRDLVNKWFLGLDHPRAIGAYSAVGGVLFARGGPSYADVCQGYVGDCWLLASLAETAYRKPGIIQSMFTANGNGTWTVRFYINGKPDYVTVDNQLPSGGTLYDLIAGRPLWVALAEKAFVQENVTGRLQTTFPGANFYGALDGGDPSVALAAISGLPTSDFNVDPSQLGTAWKKGQLLALTTPDHPTSGLIVPDHCYAVLGYNQMTGAVTFLNPWGMGGGYLGASGAYYPGYVTIPGKALTRNFDELATSGTSKQNAGRLQATGSGLGHELARQS
jgi:hypothetical protein